MIIIIILYFYHAEPQFLSVSLPTELYFTGDCNDNDTKTQIKKQVLVYLREYYDKFQTICSGNNTCKIDNLDVTCGEASRRKRQSGFSHQIHKRNANGLISFNILRKWEQGNKTMSQAYIDILFNLISIENNIVRDVNSGLFLNVTGIMAHNEGVQRSKANLFCNPGYKVDIGSLLCSKNY
jgi:hypothetical protein